MRAFLANRLLFLFGTGGRPSLVLSDGRRQRPGRPPRCRLRREAGGIALICVHGCSSCALWPTAVSSFVRHFGIVILETQQEREHLKNSKVFP